MSGLVCCYCGEAVEKHAGRFPSTVLYRHVDAGRCKAQYMNGAVLVDPVTGQYVGDTINGLYSEVES